MKTKILLILALSLACALLFGCAAQQNVKLAYIGADEAKALALSDAGLDAQSVDNFSTDMSTRDGLDYYSVRFTANGESYSYDVDALTGRILARGGAADAAQSVPAAAAQLSPTAEAASAQLAPAAATAAAGEIGAEQAKSIALAHAGLAEDEVEFVRSQLEYDDGRREYELEFYTADGMEYDYDIDAHSGRILSHDRDAEYYRPAAQQSGSGQSGSGASISEAEARAIALAQVPGADESHIRKFRIDRDDGRLEYDGEIVYNNMEYEFEIDAYSGAIRDWDVESVFDD